MSGSVRVYAGYVRSRPFRGGRPLHLDGHVDSRTNPGWISALYGLFIYS
jgi:hypothetical protein